MRAFNLFYKVLRKHLPIVLVYLVLFFTIFSVNIASFNKEETEVYIQKIRLKVFDEDESELSKGLKKYLEENNSLVDVKKDKQLILDTIYQDQLDYALIIPKDFEKNFGKEEKADLTIYNGIEANKNEIVNRQIESYLSLYDVYKTQFEGNLEKEDKVWISKQLEKNFKDELEMSLVQDDLNVKIDLVFMQFFLSFTDYVMIAIAIQAMGVVLTTFEEPKKRMRDLVSGQDQGKRSVGFLIASFSFMLILWCLVVGLGALMMQVNVLDSPVKRTMLLSNFAHMLAVTSMAVLLVAIFKKKETLGFLGTLLSLLISFSAGVFIPIDFLWGPFHKASMVFPTFYDIENLRSLSSIAILENFSIDSYLPNIFVMLGFALFYFVIGLVVRRLEKKN